MTTHKIIFGDSRDMKLVEDKSVQLIITSPPYWQIKDYGTDNQIGYNDSYEDYINNLNLVWKESERVLSDGCKLCINIGDQFARTEYYGRYKVIPIRTEIIRFCETIGLDYVGAIIWQKQTNMKTSGGGAIMGSFPYPRNGILKIDYEFILIFKKSGKAPKPTEEQKELSKMSKEEWNSYFSSHWNFSGIKQKEHIAMFPEELPRRLIKMYSFVGDTILDPFVGSGTTSLVAKKLSRNSIGYEINKEFKSVIEKKLTEGQLSLSEFISDIEFKEDSDISFSLSTLPYIFKDTVKIERKTNQLREIEPDLINVNKVLSPNRIELSDGKIIELLGVKINSDNEYRAIKWLEDKLGKRKVFYKLDSTISSIESESNEEPNELVPQKVYLYLANKTFINNHLIRTKYVNVDDSIDYKFKNKFIKSFNN